MSTPLPLAGIVVLDLSRMLPGAVLARLLLDLGARVIKLEEPRHGDMMRQAPPLAGGVGAGFAAFYRGAESIGLDLKRPEDAQAALALARRADVLIESFRPGTLEAWGLGYERLAAEHPGLIYCSLSGFGPHGGMGDRVGHDLNFAGMAGLLSMLPPGGLPRVQLADVSTGMLAATSVLAALLARHRDGRGTRLDQPLAVGPLPLMAWTLADTAAGGEGFPDRVLAGEAPGYRVYRCGDGQELAVGAIEPKFWATLMQQLDLPELAGDGLALGAAGEAVAARVAERFASAPRAHWLALAERDNLPVTPVNERAEVLQDPYYQAQPGWLPSWTPPAGAVPALGADTARVLAEFGVQRTEASNS